MRSVAATTDYGAERANGVWLLEQALNLKTPVIYDTVVNDGKEESTSCVCFQPDRLACHIKKVSAKDGNG